MKNKELMRKLLLVEKERQRRDKLDNLKNYNRENVHKKHMELHRCNKRNRGVFGGNRSGKTECGAVEVVWLARGIHPYKENKPTTGWVVSLSQQVQRDVAQSKVLHYLHPDWIADIIMLSGRKDAPEYGVIDYILVKNVFGSISRIGFKTCDQGREKFQGTSLDYVWFDEEPPFEIYIECRMRVLDRQGLVFGTMTPLKGLTWVYDKIYLNDGGDENVWYIEMEWADNPYLSQAEIDALSATLSTEELDSRRYGKFCASGGLVYKEFDPSVHIIEPFSVPRDWFDNISIDPGLHNPLSAHWYAADYDGNVYVIAEHYEAEQTLEHHAECIKRKCELLDWPVGFDGKIHALIDSAANQKTLASPKSVTDLFFEYGINVNPNVNKDLFSGISKVKSYLRNAKGEARLFIFSTCVNMIREIKGYWWGKADVPVKKDDHSLDELRYYIMSRVDNMTSMPMSNDIQKHKDRLINKHKNDFRNRRRL